MTQKNKQITSHAGLCGWTTHQFDLEMDSDLVQGITLELGGSVDLEKVTFAGLQRGDKGLECVWQFLSQN